MNQKLVTSSNKELSINYSLNSKESFKITNIEKAINSNTPSLNKIIKENSILKAEGIIEAMLTQLNDKIKFKEKLSENEIERLAQSIISKYSGLKISDFIFVFNQIADGEVELYGSLSHRDIMKALFKHKETRWHYKKH